MENLEEVQGGMMDSCEIASLLGSEEIDAYRAFKNWWDINKEYAKQNLAEVFFVIDFLSKKGEDHLFLQSRNGITIPVHNLVNDINDCQYANFRYKEVDTVVIEDGKSKIVRGWNFTFWHLNREDFLYLEEKNFKIVEVVGEPFLKSRGKQISARDPLFDNIKPLLICW